MLTSHQREKEDCTTAETISCPQAPQFSQSRCQPCFLHLSKPSHTRSDLICTKIIRIGQKSAPSHPLSAKQRLTQSVNLGSRSAVMFDLTCDVFRHSLFSVCLLMKEIFPVLFTRPSIHVLLLRRFPPTGWRQHCSASLRCTYTDFKEGGA